GGTETVPGTKVARRSRTPHVGSSASIVTRAFFPIALASLFTVTAGAVPSIIRTATQEPGTSAIRSRTTRRASGETRPRSLVRRSFIGHGLYGSVESEERGGEPGPF